MKKKLSKKSIAPFLVFIAIILYMFLSETLKLVFDQRILFEIIVTAAISIGVFTPVSFIISPTKSKLVYWILFASRIILLLILNPIVKDIYIYDFLSVFVGVIIIVPIARSFVKNNIPNPRIDINNISAKASDMLKDESSKVEMNYAFMKSEKVILKNIIRNEMAAQGEKKILTREAVNKQNIIILIFMILTFLCITMFFFNVDTKLCFALQILLIILFVLAYQSANTINVLVKKSIKNPNDDISTIVNKAKASKVSIIIPNPIKILLGLMIVVINAASLFYNPRLLYLKYGEGYMLFKYTRGITYESAITIPNEYNGLTVTTIGAKAFKNSSIKTVNLPERLESIKTEAFYNANQIVNITIPSTVTEIRGSAFENCEKLKTVNLNEGLLSIRGKAFKNNVNLTNIKLPTSLEYLGAGAFSKCSSLIEMTIPEKVTEINGQTFEYCTSLKRIFLHDEIISIHGEVFKGCTSLNNVKLPSKITEIRGNTFEGCSSLTNITIPEGVTRIGGHAFYGCTSLKTVSAPSTLKEIGSSAFRRCYSLDYIVIPRETLVNERAFKETSVNIRYLYDKNYNENKDEIDSDGVIIPHLENKMNATNKNMSYIYADEYTFKEKNKVIFEKEYNPFGIKLTLNKITNISNTIEYNFVSEGIITSNFLLNNYTVKSKNISDFFIIEIISNDIDSVTVRIYHN